MKIKAIVYKLIIAFIIVLSSTILIVKEYSFAAVAATPAYTVLTNSNNIGKSEADKKNMLGGKYRLRAIGASVVDVDPRFRY